MKITVLILILAVFVKELPNEEIKTVKLILAYS